MTTGAHSAHLTLCMHMCGCIHSCACFLRTRVADQHLHAGEALQASHLCTTLWAMSAACTLTVHGYVDGIAAQWMLTAGRV